MNAGLVTCKTSPMNTAKQSRKWVVAGWSAVAILAGPVTVAAIWLAAASGFVVVPGQAPKFTGQQGRERDFTELLATAEQTGGSLGVVRQTIAPHSGPPDHVHHGEDEFLYALSGNFKVKVGDKVVDAPAQTLVFVPRGTAHAFTNTGDAPAVMLVGITPGGFEKIFQERQGVDAKANAELMKAHGMEVVGPPLK